jgi:hypothetical protein
VIPQRAFVVPVAVADSFSDSFFAHEMKKTTEHINRTLKERNFIDSSYVRVFPFFYIKSNLEISKI